jgi:DNA-nicking Smr family endonuclease
MSTSDTPRRRRLTDEEHVLWRGVARSVAPLKRGRARKLIDADADIAASAPKADKPGPPKKNKAIVHAHAAPSVAKPKTRPPAKPPTTPPPPLMPIDRRTRLRIARGAEAIDARIDLHGRTQSEAHGVLLSFLRRVQADGARTVLVITGKGGRDQGRERGVLRRQVPLWLMLPEFRLYVLGIEDAHVGHGGEGALYVRVRRAR